MFKIRPIILGNALAATSGIFFAVCALFAAVTPGSMHSVGRAWYGSMAIDSGGVMQAGSMTWGMFFVGLFWLLIGAWLFGVLLGFLYNGFGGENAEAGSGRRPATGVRQRTAVS